MPLAQGHAGMHLISNHLRAFHKCLLSVTAIFLKCLLLLVVLVLVLVVGDGVVILLWAQKTNNLRISPISLAWFVWHFRKLCGYVFWLLFSFCLAFTQSMVIFILEIYLNCSYFKYTKPYRYAFSPNGFANIAITTNTTLYKKPIGTELVVFSVFFLALFSLEFIFKEAMRKTNTNKPFALFHLQLPLQQILKKHWDILVFFYIIAEQNLQKKTNSILEFLATITKSILNSFHFLLLLCLCVVYFFILWPKESEWEREKKGILGKLKYNAIVHELDV